MAPSISSIESSYRTYEEWKPAHDHKLLLYLAGSYRTYEEWKPLRRQASVQVRQGSYRTYEEWKLFIVCNVDMSGRFEFLPYL